MKSQRAHEGYLLLDNSVSPGISDDVARRAGLPPGAGRGVFEAPTLTCSHCQRVVVLSPTRVRDRAFCPKCNHGVCDNCELVRVASGGDCKTMEQVFDEVREKALREQKE